jgi:hypothetical protein
MSIKERIVKILIFSFPVLNDLDFKINGGLLLFITNPFMKYHNVLKILNSLHKTVPRVNFKGGRVQDPWTPPF